MPSPAQALSPQQFPSHRSPVMHWVGWSPLGSAVNGGRDAGVRTGGEGSCLWFSGVRAALCRAGRAQSGFSTLPQMEATGMGM